MKTLLFTLSLTFFLLSCQTPNENEQHVGDFTNYYNQYQEHTNEKEMFVHQHENDSIQLNSMELVIK